MGVSYKPWQDSLLTLSRLYQSGSDGFRIYDAIGLSQSYKIDENLSFVAGYEKGIEHDSGDGDFDAFNISMQKDSKWYNSTASLEYRNSNREDSLNLAIGMHIVQSDAIGMAFGAGYHNLWSVDKSSTTLDAKMGFVYRPEMTDWIALDRFDYNDNDSSDGNTKTKTRKFINNLHIHWQPDIKWKLGVQYGLKHVTDTIDNDKYSSWTDLIGLDVSYDINPKWSLGLQGSILHSYTGSNYDYGFGAFVGTSIWDNSDITIGYNIEGFDDDDFSQQNYHFGGAYIRLRMKFDQDNIKGLIKGVME